MPSPAPEQIRTGTPVTSPGRPRRGWLGDMLLAVFLVAVFATITGAFLPAAGTLAGLVWQVFGLTVMTVWAVRAIVARRRLRR